MSEISKAAKRVAADILTDISLDVVSANWEKKIQDAIDDELCAQTTIMLFAMGFGREEAASFKTRCPKSSASSGGDCVWTHWELPDWFCQGRPRIGELIHLAKNIGLAAGRNQAREEIIKALGMEGRTR